MSRWRYDPELDEVVEVGKAPARQGWKTLVCESMGVDGNTIEEAQQMDQLLGAPHVEYDAETKSPIFHDNDTYNAYLKAHGMVNRTSGKGNHALTPAMLKRLQERFDESEN